MKYLILEDDNCANIEVGTFIEVLDWNAGTSNGIEKISVRTHREYTQIINITCIIRG